jgi:thioredoxin-dependent peroxiredoxin
MLRRNLSKRANNMRQIGEAVPDFSLSTDGGKSVSKKGLLGQRYVLYFYPKDDTPGCTKEACGFRDQRVQFDASKVQVFGVSADTAAAHDKFVKKFELNFPLISDPERVLIEGMGVWVEKSMYGKKYMGIARATFVIDADGLVEQVWEKVSVESHAEDVYRYIAGGAGAAPAKAAAKKVAPKPITAEKTVAKKVATKKATAKTVKK